MIPLCFTKAESVAILRRSLGLSYDTERYRMAKDRAGRRVPWREFALMLEPLGVTPPCSRVEALDILEEE